MRQLHFETAYRGWKTGGQLIPAGTYAESDPILQGSPEYFVDKGFAVLFDISEAVVVEVSSEIPQEALSVDISDDDAPDIQGSLSFEGNFVPEDPQEPEVVPPAKKSGRK